jgi:hypothetical protein
MENENLQSLAMTLCVRARNLHHEMMAVSMLVTSMQQIPSASRSRRQIVDLLNRVCVGVSYVAEETKKMVFWLDRFVQFSHSVCIFYARTLQKSLRPNASVRNSS